MTSSGRTSGCHVQRRSMLITHLSSAVLTLQYSNGKPLNAICGRGDLDSEKPRAYGCYDTKVANYRMAQQLRSEGVVGPAGAEAGLQPFSWNGTAHDLQEVSHVGEADSFAFEIDLLKPASLLASRHSLSMPVSS